MGKKYIIELEDEPFCQDDGNFVYKVKGFNNIVFSMMDFGGLGTLTPYTEPDLEKIRKEAYKDVYNAGFGKKIYTSYQEGLSDAWEAARKICTNWCISDDVLALIFGKGKTIDDIMREFTASKAIEEIRAYEQAQKEKEEQEREEQIQVGDEIEAVSGKAVVVYVDDVDEHKVRYVYSNGVYAFNYIDKVTKTGRHFPEVAAVLEKMRESE